MGEAQMSGISEAVKQVTGTAVPVQGNDIDTDQIIPARFMKVVTFEGLGEYAFYDVRFDPSGTAKPHPFNDDRYGGASVLLVNSNFGCGSSREHAPQALMRWGIKVVIGESFAEIFAGNCTAMGVPAVSVAPEVVRELVAAVEADPSTQITVDLPHSTVTVGQASYRFEMPPAYRSALIAGSWDSTSVLLSNLEGIAATTKRLPYLNGFRVA